MWLITAQAIRRQKKCSVISFCWCLTSCQKEKIFWRWTPVDLSFHRAHLFTAATTKQVKCYRFSSASRSVHNIKHVSLSSQNETPLIHLDGVLFGPRSVPSKPSPSPRFISTWAFQAPRNSNVISSRNGTCKCAAEFLYPHWVLAGVRFIRPGSVEAVRD